ncbi:hypothetical protein [Stagnihabitans tardus]|uniref:Uncharacterized protein n=1 Tax=Stagnihabitans tardus TaxID=2699202 RepID=A0AAE4YC29_9RHOB|nr:hypothetical protein [Stagnihabitans tardus]NBZ89967.1 hypothetical protein [Stagnihabitans tardus]
MAHIHFAGHVTAEDTLDAAARFAATPGVHPDLHQLIDFSHVASFERDYVKLLAMFARLPEHLVHAGHQPIFVYVVPTKIGQDMAQFVIRSMEGMDGGPILRMAPSLPEALALLGLSIQSLSRTE